MRKNKCWQQIDGSFRPQLEIVGQSEFAALHRAIDP
jgi:hypothetical protein